MAGICAVYWTDRAFEVVADLYLADLYLDSVEFALLIEALKSFALVI